LSAGFTLRLVNRPTEVARLIDEFVKFARLHALSERMIGDMSLALDELLTNVIAYGLPPTSEHEIGAEIRLERDRLVAEITDSGRPFNPFEEAPAPDLDSQLANRRVGGLGVYLVKQLMDETSYRRDGTTNVTWIARFTGRQ